MVRVAAVVFGALAMDGVLGCGSEVDRQAYVDSNETLFEQLPSFPGARVVGETSAGYRSNESGPIVGFGTRFDLELPSEATASDVTSFFRSRLTPDWRLVETLDGPVLNFRMNKAAVSINLENAHVHKLEIAVDHAYYGELEP